MLWVTAVLYGNCLAQWAPPMWHSSYTEDMKVCHGSESDTHFSVIHTDSHITTAQLSELCLIFSCPNGLTASKLLTDLTVSGHLWHCVLYHTKGHNCEPNTSLFLLQLHPHLSRLYHIHLSLIHSWLFFDPHYMLWNITTATLSAVFANRFCRHSWWFLRFLIDSYFSLWNYCDGRDNLEDCTKATVAKPLLGLLLLQLE